jgi:uridine kinase
VRPMHLQFVEPSKRYADIIIPEGGHNEVGIDLITGKIKSILARLIEQSAVAVPSTGGEVPQFDDLKSQV